ncbi:MAG: rhomboid family intramembrane serine protease [Planctomycetaceae bacterium]|nr:rhomboid family intramembrane serine protease [Planctomycetaceae bacterium]
MFFPINTDAPLYHRPIGTIGLIVANWITYALTNGGHAHEGWILTFGQGMHPLEWVSSAFLHFGIMHLLGNMLFLWSYGLIIEGKIGTFWFLLTYFAMCLIHGAIVQSVMLWADPVGGAGGASGVIFAMLAIALVWAPLNTFDVVWFFWFGFIARAGRTEASVITLSCFYLALNLFWATIWASFFESVMSSEFLHLTGAMVGFPIAFAFLAFGWVDCENWDLISVWKGKHRGLDSTLKMKDWKTSSSADEIAIPKRTPAKKLLRKLEDLIDRRAFEGAYRVYRVWSETRATGSDLDVRRLQKLIEGLRKIRMYKEAAVLIENDLLQRPLNNDVRPRLMLAGICVKELTRPKAALRTLEPIDESRLPDEEQKLVLRIRAAANAMIEDGVVELSLD